MNSDAPQSVFVKVTKTGVVVYPKAAKIDNSYVVQFSNIVNVAAHSEDGRTQTDVTLDVIGHAEREVKLSLTGGDFVDFVAEFLSWRNSNNIVGRSVNLAFSL